MSAEAEHITAAWPAPGLQPRILSNVKVTMWLNILVSPWLPASNFGLGASFALIVTNMIIHLAHEV